MNDDIRKLKKNRRKLADMLETQSLQISKTYGIFGKHTAQCYRLGWFCKARGYQDS